MVPGGMGCGDDNRRFVPDFPFAGRLVYRGSLRLMNYVELHARSAFSFLRGASTPEQLAIKAGELEIPALALCDRDGLYGAPRLFGSAKETGIRAIVGAELTMEDQTILPVLVE